MALSSYSTPFLRHEAPLRVSRQPVVLSKREGRVVRRQVKMLKERILIGRV